MALTQRIPRTAGTMTEQVLSASRGGLRPRQQPDLLGPVSETHAAFRSLSRDASRPLQEKETQRRQRLAYNQAYATEASLHAAQEETRRLEVEVNRKNAKLEELIGGPTLADERWNRHQKVKRVRNAINEKHKNDTQAKRVLTQEAKQLLEELREEELLLRTHLYQHEQSDLFFQRDALRRRQHIENLESAEKVQEDKINLRIQAQAQKAQKLNDIKLNRYLQNEERHKATDNDLARMQMAEEFLEDTLRRKDDLCQSLQDLDEKIEIAKRHRDPFRHPAEVQKRRSLSLGTFDTQGRRRFSVKKAVEKRAAAFNETVPSGSAKKQRGPTRTPQRSATVLRSGNQRAANRVPRVQLQMKQQQELKEMEEQQQLLEEQLQQLQEQQTLILGQQESLEKQRMQRMQPRSYSQSPRRLRERLDSRQRFA